MIDLHQHAPNAGNTLDIAVVPAPQQDQAGAPALDCGQEPWKVQIGRHDDSRFGRCAFQADARSRMSESGASFSPSSLA
jgi:hypothetical protein